MKRDWTDRELLRELVAAWDLYRLGDVAKLMQIARARVGLVLPEKNKDRYDERAGCSPVRPSADDPTGDQEREHARDRK